MDCRRSRQLFSIFDFTRFVTTLMERAIIRAKSRYSPESVVGTGNCTLPYFCDSRQGEKKSYSRVSFGRVGRVTGNKNFFFFWPNIRHP